MKYLHLIWAALLRRKARTVFTLLSVLIAFLLFGLLDTVRSAFAHAGQSLAGQDRVLIFSRMGFTRQLPYSLLERIRKVPGVTEVDYASYVWGRYQDYKRGIPVEAHPDTFYQLYPEVEVSPADLAALRRTRTGVLVGESLAKKLGLKAGDKIPLKSPNLRKDGSTTWTFDMVGILRWKDPSMKHYEHQMFGNWDYLEEARAADNGTVTYYSVKVANIADVDRVARTIDAFSANSDHETKSQSENSWAAAQASRFADMGLIVTSIMGAVFFTLVLVSGHTMAQAVHERVPEIAVLKTIGFSSCSIMGLVLCESVLLLLLGGVLGLAVATIAVVVAPEGILPFTLSAVNQSVWLRGLAFALAIGLVVGTQPALSGLRLRIADALSDR